MRRHLPALTACLLAPMLLTACGGDTPDKSVAPVTSSAPAGSSRVVQAREAVALIARAGTVIVDVRTPAEYAAGHVAGASNVDIQGAAFDGEISALGREAAYVVYCRSGNRSAAAAEIMRAKGFTNVADAGGFADLASAGAAVSLASALTQPVA